MSTTNGDWIGSPTDTALGTTLFAGGLRDRLIYDSLWYCFNASLGGLGWFDATIYDTPVGTRQNRPVTLQAQQIDWTEEISPNTIAFAPDNETDQDWELGTSLSQQTWRFYCTIIAESEPISVQLAGDVRDILRGRLSTIERDGGPYVNLYNWSAATPYRIGYLEIQNVSILRMPLYSEKWQRYMREVTWEALDWYSDDSTEQIWQFEP